MKCHRVIRTITKEVLRIASNNKEFVRSEPIELEGARLGDEVTQATKNNEAIAAIDASVKDEKMAGAWKIEDDCKINRCQSELFSNRWTQNADIAADAIAMLDIATTVVKM